MSFRHVVALATVLIASTAAAQNAAPKADAPAASATAQGTVKPASSASAAQRPVAPGASQPGGNPTAEPSAQTPGGGVSPQAPQATTAAPAEAVAQSKPGDATAGQGKAAACGACHGLDGNSTDAQYPRLAGQNEAYIVRQLTDFKAGIRQNPIMLGMATPLTPQDMHDIGAYFASKKSLPGVADQALVDTGAKLYREGDTTRGIPACMACHGPDGRGNPGAMYPQLAGQHANYVQATLKSWHDGGNWGTDAHAKIMPAIAQKLDDKDIAALSSYVEGLHTNEPAAAPAAN